jgi:hypothetical protein
MSVNLLYKSVNLLYRSASLLYKNASLLYRSVNFEQVLAVLPTIKKSSRPKHDNESVLTTLPEFLGVH